MKYAILSDIHGNQYALEACLREVNRLKIDHLLLLGDYIGYYYGAKEVISELVNWENFAIRGNHEELLFKSLNNQTLLNRITSKYGKALEMTINNLNEVEWQWLKTLQKQRTLRLGNYEVLLCHGSPWHIDEYIYPDAEEKILKKYDNLSYDFIFFGHTHYTTHFNRDKVQVINPGSVGQSRQKGGVAFWGIFDCDLGNYIQQQTNYSTAKLKKVIKKVDPQVKYNYRILERESSE